MAGVKATAPGPPTNHEFSDDESFGSIVSDALMSNLGTEEESSNEVTHENPSQHLQATFASPSSTPVNSLSSSLASVVISSHLPVTVSVCVPTRPTSSTAIHLI